MDVHTPGENGNGRIVVTPHRIPTRDEIDRFLQNQQSTLWGKAYDIHSAEGRERATEWFHKQIVDLFESL